MTEKKIHHGRSIKRLREMIGMKQDALALELGADWTQQRISLLEQKDTIDDPLLQQVAGALKIPVEAIRNFDEDAAINIVSNIFQDFKGNAVASAMNYQCSFNPIDKIVELYESKISLYERMLKDRDGMMEKLEQLIRRAQS